MNSDAQVEINMFLRATEMNQANINLGGFFDVNRTLFKSVSVAFYGGWDEEILLGGNFFKIKKGTLFFKIKKFLFVSVTVFKNLNYFWF